MKICIDFWTSQACTINLFRGGFNLGKALRRLHITFFTSRMDEHDRVSDWVLIPDEHEYLFRITQRQTGSERDVIVHLTDAYSYSLAEFYARPKKLKAGSFVVIGMPHANAGTCVIEKAKEHRIGIGHIGKFMGALNSRNIWEYMNMEERKEEEEKKRRREEMAEGSQLSF